MLKLALASYAIRNEEHITNVVPLIKSNRQQNESVVIINGY